MTNEQKEPVMPAMPPCRVSYESIGGQLMFSSQAELDKWKAEPFWKKLLGLTEYDKRLNARE